MRRYRDALDRLLEAARERGRRPFQTVPLKDALGRIASSELRGGEDLPAFDNSAMDGFAVPSRLTIAATSDKPVRLPVAAALVAGDAPSEAPAGAAVEIMTGAPVPRGCDAVVRLEDVERLDGGRAIALREPASPGDFVRPRGGDFARGATVLAEGDRLQPQHILALAALGVERVSVRIRPRVAVVSTGAELVEVGQKLQPGQVRNATGPYLDVMLERLGCQIISRSAVGDAPAAFRARIESLLDDDLDLIVTTGAVSMGSRDYVPDQIQALAGEILFHKTATRPGKPVLAARLGHGPLLLGLPGNPVSTAAALRFFVDPVLRFWLAMPEEKPLRARLAARVEKPEGLRCFFKAELELDESGARVRCLPGQASFQIQPLLEADCWAVLPEEGTALEAGAVVETYPL